ncbi:MAG: protein translocase subunit SecF [Patescibacteria group bacterium]|nr:protein translocase subunit SecF [Patescibacteria group bacterium]
MFNTLKYYKFWFTVSGLILAFGVISLSMFGLRLGIDFKGGTLTELKFDQKYDLQKVKDVLATENIGNYQLQTSEENGLIIKTESVDKAIHDKMLADLKQQIGEFKEAKFDSIGPVIGNELRRDAILQLVMVSLGIVAYIAYAFRRVPKPITSWRFGWSAVVALLHDLLFVLGVFSVLGHFKGVEIDGMFVTALLTVLGFSVHDTIVVFDRIRENLKVYSGQSIEYVVNKSIGQTIVRSLNTSLTVLFVLLTLLLFGGDTIRYFVLALFIGIFVGTYSSIFIASPILVVWQNWKAQK